MFQTYFSTTIEVVTSQSV